MLQHLPFIEWTCHSVTADSALVSALVVHWPVAGLLVAIAACRCLPGWTKVLWLPVLWSRLLALMEPLLRRLTVPLADPETPWRGWRLRVHRLTIRCRWCGAGLASCTDAAGTAHARRSIWS